MSNQVSTLSMSKEFKKTPIGEIPVEWDLVQLGDVSKQSDEKFDPLRNGSRPYVGLEHIEGKTGKLSGVGKSEDVTSLKTVFSKGDILFGKLRSYLRKVARAPYDGVCSTDILVIKPSSKIDPNFLLYVLQSENAINHSINTSAGTKMPRTSWGLFSKLPIPLPTLIEQKKIAEILSAVDDAIQKTEAVIEKTKELKKASISQLISKGIGHTRFKKTKLGEIPAEWGVKTVGELAELYSGGTPSRTNPRYFKGNIPWIKSGELNREIIDYAEEFISEEAVKDSSVKWVSKGNVLVALYGATVGQIGRLKINATINQAILAVIPKETQVTSEYLFYALKSRIRYLISITQGSGQPNLSQEIVSSLEIPVPPISEQKKIAEILSILDRVLALENEFKSKMEFQKQALMQMLLTGKVRV